MLELIHKIYKNVWRGFTETTEQQTVKHKIWIDIKCYAEDESAGKTNFACHGENTVRNHKTSKTTTNSMKETKNENTEMESNVSSASSSYWLYAEAMKKGQVDKW